MVDGYGFCNGISTDPNEAQEKLKAQVLRRMEQGWTPLGGVSVTYIPSTPTPQWLFVQTIVSETARAQHMKSPKDFNA